MILFVFKYFWLVKYRNEIHENKWLPYLNPCPTHRPDLFSRYDRLHFVLIVLVPPHEKTRIQSLYEWFLGPLR